MQERPIMNQFAMMNLGPRLDQPLLRPRQIAGNAFEWIEREHGREASRASLQDRSALRFATPSA